MKMYPIYFKMHVIDQGSSTPALKVFPAEFSYNLGQTQRSWFSCLDEFD